VTSNSLELFSLLLLLATILGFVLSGNPALRDQLIDSALGQVPVIGTDLRSEVHPRCPRPRWPRSPPPWRAA
jgi:hypothetical protein